MMQEVSKFGSAGKEGQSAHLFLVSCPQVAHSKGSPITYLFVVHASCPPEARRHENWGLVERVDIAETEIARGGIGEARMDLQSRAPTREWRISVGNRNGLLFREVWVEEEGEHRRLPATVKRIPESVLLIEDSLVDAFTSACRSAGMSYTVHVNPFALCADCVELGCTGCETRSEEEKKRLKGKKFHLV